MRILMVGAGATGGFYGGLLAKAGRDVTFLVRANRAQQLREAGLEIVTPEGSFVVRPKLITATELRDAAQVFDLIIISPKAYQLEVAMEDFAPAVGAETMLLPILNGMRHLDLLDARFGAERVLGGTVRIVSDLDTAGRVHRLTSLDEMSYGERTGGRTARVEAVDEAMQGAGFDARLQPDILATMWQKWWILASMGAICVLAGGTIGEAAAAPYGEEIALQVVKECTEIASAHGYVPDPAMLASHRRRMVERGSTLTSSMYRDMIKGAPVEADHILGDLLSRAKDVETALLKAAYLQLKVYEAGRE
jgi:2-dehydropantoate 2-reductase